MGRERDKKLTVSKVNKVFFCYRMSVGINYVFSLLSNTF